jgi:hypothetical protein
MRLILLIVVAVYGGIVLITGWWTITGHCCGSPLVAADWDSCLPVQDKDWTTRTFGNGHCDEGAWKRVPN